MRQENTSQGKTTRNTLNARLKHSRRTFLGGTAALGLNGLVGDIQAADHQKTNEEIDKFLYGKYIVCIGYDFDTIIFSLPDAQNSPTELSRGIFGAEVGVPHLLDLHRQLSIPATFFIPGQTIESFL